MFIFTWGRLGYLNFANPSPFRVMEVTVEGESQDANRFFACDVVAIIDGETIWRFCNTQTGRYFVRLDPRLGVATSFGQPNIVTPLITDQEVFVLPTMWHRHMTKIAAKIRYLIGVEDMQIVHTAIHHAHAHHAAAHTHAAAHAATAQRKTAVHRRVVVGIRILCEIMALEAQVAGLPFASTVSARTAPRPF